jgi:hypothetical protein
MNNKGCGKKWPWPNFKEYLGVRLEGLMKTTKHLSQYSQSPDRDLKLGSPEFGAGVLTTRSRRFVCINS